MALDDRSRRDFLSLAASGTLAGATLGRGALGTVAAPHPGTTHGRELDVRAFGAQGDGQTLDTLSLIHISGRLGITRRTITRSAMTFPGPRARIS